MDSTVNNVRWMARLLSLPILIFFGIFIGAEVIGAIFGGPESPGTPLTMKDRIGFTLIIVWFLGLAAAWKWEFIGGAVSLAALVTLCFIFPQILKIPWYYFPPITALLFLFCGWMSRRSRQKKSVPANIAVQSTPGQD